MSVLIGTCGTESQEKAHQAKAVVVLVILTSFLGIAKKEAVRRLRTRHDDYRRSLSSETGSISIRT